MTTVARHHSELKRIPIHEWTDDELAKQLVDLTKRATSRAQQSTHRQAKGSANDMAAARRVGDEIRRRSDH